MDKHTDIQTDMYEHCNSFAVTAVSKDFDGKVVLATLCHCTGLIGISLTRRSHYFLMFGMLQR